MLQWTASLGCHVLKAIQIWMAGRPHWSETSIWKRSLLWSVFQSILLAQRHLVNWRNQFCSFLKPLLTEASFDRFQFKSDSEFDCFTYLRLQSWPVHWLVAGFYLQALSSHSGHTHFLLGRWPCRLCWNCLVSLSSIAKSFLVFSAFWVIRYYHSAFSSCLGVLLGYDHPLTANEKTKTICWRW